jgi:DDE family transposase
MKGILEAIRDCFNSIPDEDRRSRVPPFEFVAALVFAIGEDLGPRSLTFLRRKVGDLTGVLLGRSSFWERLATQRLTEMLSFIVSQLMVSLGKKIGLSRAILASLGVSGLYVLDSTSSTLPEGAAKDFPAPRKNVVPAAIKWHALFDFFSGTVAWFDLTPAKVHDRNGFPPFEVLPKGVLLIFDLGYWDYQLLSDLIKGGFYFLSRIKSNASITIDEITAGIARKYEGRDLMSCCFPANAGLIVELIGSFQKAGKEIFSCRVVGFWNPIEQGYHWYATNLKVSAHLIYPLYRLRWQCELAFKACKSAFNFADITTADCKIIKNLVLIGIIHCLISLAIGNVAANDLSLEQQLAKSVQRSAVLFVHIANALFQFVSRKLEIASLTAKIKLFSPELYDPNYNRRQSSLARVYALL